MYSNIDTQWEPSEEYENLVEREERFSQYKLELACQKEQIKLSAPSPIFNIIFNFFQKLKKKQK